MNDGPNPGHLPVVYNPHSPSRPLGPGPGWYPDPAGRPALRWYDGQQWTAHLQAAPMPAAVPMHYYGGGGSGSAAVAVAVTSSGPSHLLHLVLTILTLGLWLPVWILIAIFSRPKTTVATSTAAGGGR
jgi:hypothetical protein